MTHKYNANATHNYHAGIGHVGSYQVSGYPYLTGSSVDGDGLDSGSTAKISFPSVAKSVTVINQSTGTGDDLRVSFNAPESSDSNVGFVNKGHHYITLTNKLDSVTFNVKCKEIYITSVQNGSHFELFAELTGIHTGSMYNLTGSGLTSYD
tara:strand:+ start:349 stop:801 length:453 start_codon:yes stop_codon:yes gene_type:complete